MMERVAVRWTCRFVSLFALLFITLPALAQDAATAAAQPEAPQLKTVVASLELNDGDTLVFLGDSITHQCLYTQYVEDYFYTRYPDRRIHFHNSGVGGDAAGDALARFDEDVAAFKPKYVTILLGMNDGRYTRFEQPIFDTYEKGMTTLLDKIEQAGATAILMGPTIFDSRAVALNPKKPTSELRDKYYNAVLAFFGAWCREQATNRGLGYVDMYALLNEATFEQRKTDANFTMIGDAVHPGPAGQAVMAYALLSDMGAKKAVSSVNLMRRGDGWKAAGDKEGRITDISATQTGVKFTFLAPSLPWVLPEEAAQGYKLTRAGHTMSNERLRVTGLDEGTYELRIDGKTVGTYSALQLAAKIELQENAQTPQYQQALAVANLNKEKNDKAMRPVRNLWGGMKGKRREQTQKPEEFAKFKAHFDAELPKLLASVKEYEDRIYQLNQPQPHVYELVRVEKATQ